MASSNGSIMLILSSPSGAGKTTLTKKIQQKYQNFKISVSHTTRKPRTNEVAGIDYFFISHEEFEKKIKNNEFFEHAKIFDNFYGKKIMIFCLILIGRAHNNFQNLMN